METLMYGVLWYAFAWICFGALMTAAEFVAGVDIGLRRRE